MTREYVTIPKEAWDFLCGQGELDGVSFGERHPTRFGLYWWRSYIAALAPAPAPDDVALVDAFAQSIYFDNEHDGSARTALLARLRQRDDIQEDDATVERVTEAIEAADLAGKADTAEDIARAAIRALKGK